jgi:PAS domain S-box-containing protein
MKLDKPKKGRQLPGQADESYMKDTSPRDLKASEAAKLLSELKNNQLQVEKQNAELARLREELQESRDRFAAVYDCAPVGFATFDKQGVVLEANLSLADMLGVHKDSLIGSGFAQYIVLDSLDTFYSHAESVLTKGTRQYCELRLKKNDGSVLYVDFESLAVRDTSGELSFYQATILDISDRPKNIPIAESDPSPALSLSQTKSGPSMPNDVVRPVAVNDRYPGDGLETHSSGDEMTQESISTKCDTVTRSEPVLAESAEDAVIATDKDLKITLWNKAAEAMYGWTEEEALESQQSSDIRERVLGVLTRDDVMQSITENGSWAGEALAFNKDGYGLNMWVSFGVLWDHAGSFNGLKTTHRYADCRGKPPAPAVNFDIEDQIEARVIERTDELAKTNQILRQEMHKFKEAALVAQESEGKNRDLVDNIKLGIFRSTPGVKGKFLEVNIAMEEITGYTRDELLDMDVRDLFPEKNKNLLTDGVGLANWKDTRELAILKKDKTEITVAENIMTIRYDSGRILYFDGILEDITERKHAQQQIQQSLERLQKTIKEIIQAMAYIGEVRDPYTAGHQRRVAQLSFEIGRMVGLEDQKFEGLMMAAFVHDIGKIIVPADILSKPGVLTRPEFDMIKDHARIGYEILKNIEFPWPIAKIVLQHHERLNGTGYPSGLNGDEIIQEARILAVADVVEAMSSHRPYRPALGVEKALAEISQNKGTLYDPNTVEACIRLFHEKGFNLN